MRSNISDCDAFESAGEAGVGGATGGAAAAGEAATKPSSSQRMPRDKQFEHGACLLHRSFRDLQKRQETGC